MILSVARTHFAKLRRDRPGLILSFVVPVAFFSIFTLAFGGTGQGNIEAIRVAVVDEDQSRDSEFFMNVLRKDESVMVDSPDSIPTDASTAHEAIRSGTASVAIVFPNGFGKAFSQFQQGSSRDRPEVQLWTDRVNPAAAPIVRELLQRTAMARVLGNTGLREAQLLRVETRGVLSEKKKNPWIACAAAGLGVMFLFFTASSSGGALLDEAESGTLERILTTKVTMTQLLLGKLLYLTILATLQLTVTFTWAAFWFGLDLYHHLAGFFTMSIVTAVTASAFGLVLASACRSRMQLTALSNLLILVMSALGGSLYPRFLMSHSLQKLGLITINAWALDGFLKVFWREEALWNLWPQVVVLCGAASVLFFVAKHLARRWEVQ